MICKYLYFIHIISKGLNLALYPPPCLINSYLALLRGCGYYKSKPPTSPYYLKNSGSYISSYITSY